MITQEADSATVIRIFRCMCLGGLRVVVAVHPSESAFSLLRVLKPSSWTYTSKMGRDNDASIIRGTLDNDR